jgi:hypothetical protein
VVITALADNSANYPRRIGKIELLGNRSDLTWTRSSRGLEIRVPAAPAGKYAHVFRISAA